MEWLPRSWEQLAAMFGALGLVAEFTRRGVRQLLRVHRAVFETERLVRNGLADRMACIDGRSERIERALWLHVVGRNDAAVAVLQGRAIKDQRPPWLTDDDRES